jgi:methylenetetrahydrofolate reductase (NADPH)
MASCSTSPGPAAERAAGPGADDGRRALKIVDILKAKAGLSFEIFPPRVQDDADLSGIFAAIDALGAARPDFVSVTYSPAGRNRERALGIAERIGRDGLCPLSHFTAVGYGRSDVDAMLASLAERGIENILALRGDIPPGLVYPEAPWKDFRYASDLIRYIRERDEAICVGAACYPEGHPETRDPALNLARLKEKSDLGADFFITQLAFDDEAILRFVDSARRAGIAKPILIGVMPVLASSSIKRMIQLTGCSVPAELAAMIEAYAGKAEDMEKAGIEYAARQIRFLRERGADGIHLYSMNRPGPSLKILEAAGR